MKNVLQRFSQICHPSRTVLPRCFLTYVLNNCWKMFIGDFYIWGMLTVSKLSYNK
uniref:Uncharacterized protein n=1 Tax=Ascaris lumbricoides TaxID=6252 RepID=A0A0M3I864_ASCLU